MPVALGQSKGPKAASKRSESVKKSSTLNGAAAGFGVLPSVRDVDMTSTAPASLGKQGSAALSAALKRPSAPFAESSGFDAAGTAYNGRAATGSIRSSAEASANRKKSAVLAPRPPLSNSDRSRGRGGGKSVDTGSKRRGGSRGTSAGSRTNRSVSKGRSVSSSRGRGRGGRGGRGRGRGKGSRQALQLQAIASNMDALQDQEQAMRHNVEVEEELELETYNPIYNVLVMEIVRVQVEQLNRRQKGLNDTMEALRAEGLMGGGMGTRDEKHVESMVERLRVRLESEATAEVAQLRQRSSNLQHSLEEATLALEKKSSEIEVLRATHARRLARADVDSDTMRAEVQAKLHASHLEVERIKRELSHRIEIACASIRTPRYNTSMEAMRELVRQAQEEVQQHFDELTKLIVSIDAKNTFLKDRADTMHSNLPSQYRTELRKMEKDQLLNILDVLSFQEGVVETVGKAIYVITEGQHKTAVV